MARRPDVSLADGHLAAGDEGDDQVGGVAVEVSAAVVIGRGGSGSVWRAQWKNPRRSWQYASSVRPL
jgi:hypothetical protein